MLRRLTRVLSYSPEVSFRCTQAFLCKQDRKVQSLSVSYRPTVLFWRAPYSSFKGVVKLLWKVEAIEIKSLMQNVEMLVCTQHKLKILSQAEWLHGALTTNSTHETSTPPPCSQGISLWISLPTCCVVGRDVAASAIKLVYISFMHDLWYRHQLRPKISLEQLTHISEEQWLMLSDLT